ncbi:MAG: DUF1127 domain-containing protein [Pseudomonadota bacterium]
MTSKVKELQELERLLVLPVSSKILIALARRLALWSHRAASRRALQGLTAHELSDIGLSREAALLEAAKPFWRR